MSAHPRRLLLLAATTGYQIRAFGEAAARAGVELIFASDRCGELDDPWGDRAVPVRFTDLERAVASVRAALPVPPAGLLAVGDPPAALAARLAESWRLPWHPPAAAAASAHKLLTRRALAAAGLPVPWFDEFTLDAPPPAHALPFPVVVKPLALSGSRGVMRADDPEGFLRAVARLRRLLRAPDLAGREPELRTLAVVESFIEGREYAVEGVLDHGAFRTLALFDKPDPLDGPFFEETLYVTPSRATREVQAAILEAVSRAAAALGLRHGPVHAECRVGPGGVYVLEAAARPIGGLCARAVRLLAPAGESASLEDLLVRHAVGEDVSAWRADPRASAVLMVPVPRGGILRRVDGVEAALAVPGVTDVRITAKPDSHLVPLPEGRSYLGFVFARADTPAAAEAAIREAHARLRFVVDPAVPLA